MKTITPFKIILYIIFMYFVYVFYTLDFDIRNWTQEVRFFFLLSGPILSLGLLIYHNEFKDVE